MQYVLVLFYLFFVCFIACSSLHFLDNLFLLINSICFFAFYFFLYFFLYLFICFFAWMRRTVTLCAISLIYPFVYYFFLHQIVCLFINFSIFNFQYSESYTPQNLILFYFLVFLLFGIFIFWYFFYLVFLFFGIFIIWYFYF